ncbi:hypothetical protein IAQ61_006516 [Plenodomus lingam]|uniref:uncharacterized protein n=1 Tax=Leptosphaeria maculans TaxID=5022 RepID=UPI00332ADAB2|nr:hypothetical protein IAQ61_006516 [Plenodomus lingam]
MAVDNSLESLLATLTSSIQSATEALPTDDILPPKEGISLLDVKNELLLSYLQNLVFLILLKLRSRSASNGNKDTSLHPQDEVVQKLVELRVYLEKGVRPLENKLKYNIDKIIRTADDAARRTSQATAKPRSSKPARNTKTATTIDNTGSDSNISDADSAAGSDQSEDDEDEMAYAPRATAVAHSKTEAAEAEKHRQAAKDNIYRPPKITPISMPTTESKEARRDRRPAKSATLDEFIATELSGAPMTEPSIGSTITQGGRHTKSERERREENERREYEESNFTRLAPDSKKQQAKKLARQRASGGFGGEEWRSLGAGIERIERLTQKKGGKLGSLEQSRKRPVGDGPRGSGSAVGDAFEKRRKVVSRYK